MEKEKFLAVQNVIAIQLAQRVFPNGTHAVSNQTANGNLSLIYSWPINDDPSRPSKRSREVTILISLKSLENYANFAGDEQEKAREHLLRIVRDRLAGYDDASALPKGSYVEPFLINVMADWCTE